MVFGIFLVFLAIGMGLATAVYTAAGTVGLLVGLAPVATALTTAFAALLLATSRPRAFPAKDALPV